MTPDFLEALALRAQAIDKLQGWDLVSAHLADQDPGLKIRLGALWREAARLCAAAADLIDPRPLAEDDPLKALFR